MVDSVKNLVSRIDPQNKSVVQKASVETEVKASGSGRVTSPGQEASVKVSDLSKLSKEPPVDFEAVERIKTAISKGQYPIDLDRVSDALLDAYVELKSLSLALSVSCHLRQIPPYPLAIALPEHPA